MTRRPAIIDPGPDLPVRVPPHNFEAEQALLGAILLNNRAIERVSEFLRAEHFAEPLHGRIYEACLALASKNQIASAIALKSALTGDADLAEQGGDRYLAALVGGAPTVASAADYGKLVYDLALRRELIALGEVMVDEAFRPGDGTAADLAHDFEARLFAVSERTDTGDGGPRAFAGVLDETMEHAEAAMRRGGGLAGLATGLTDLDDLIGGMAPGNLLVLGARPGMGKSGLMVTIARHVAATQAPVGIFSLEMRAEELGRRAVSDTAGVAYFDIGTGRLDDSQWSRVTQARRELAALPLHIDDTPGLFIEQIRVRARRMVRRHGLGLIAIDHLHLIRGRGRDRLAELTAISASLKEMARELGIPVLALCQLNRASDTRDDKRPHLSDLRESGSIEQDADVVMFLYRAGYYLAREEPERKPNEDTLKHADRLADWHERIRQERHKAQLLIEKNRHGRTGVANIWCDVALSRFRSLAPIAEDLAA